MNNQILLGLVTIGLVASVVGVGTYAYFSDTETSTGNTMAAGTLDLNDGIATYKFTIADMKPSYDKVTEPLTLVWTSNPGKLYKIIRNIHCDTGIVSEPEKVADPAGTTNNLDDVVEFDLSMLVDNTWVQLIPYTSGLTVGSLEGVPIFLGKTGAYPGGGSVTIKQSFHMMTTANNEYQGDSCTFDEEFVLLQDNDPTYDALCDAAGEICGTLPPGL